MEEFGALFFVIILYFCVALPLRLAKKTGSEKKKNAGKPRRASFPAETFSQEKDAGESVSADAQNFGSTRLGFAAPDTVQTELLAFGGHEDLYQGSLNAVTGEGEDPCHEEQMESMHTSPAPAAEAPEGGLRLNWTGSEIVRGFVMSEVLKRKV